MKYYFNTILYVVWVILIIMLGCRGGNNPYRIFKKEINQYDKQGNKQGLWEIYSDSVLVAKGSYSDNQEDGLWMFWYENGQKKKEGNFIKGQQTGIWVEWYNDGGLMWKGTYENGKRIIMYEGEKPDITFIGLESEDPVLHPDSSYRIRIRIPNIPSDHLFIEVENGEIERGEENDLFILHTGIDSILILAVGYIQDMEFKDFRNLVEEIPYIIR